MKKSITFGIALFLILISHNIYAQDDGYIMVKSYSSSVKAYNWIIVTKGDSVLVEEKTASLYYKTMTLSQPKLNKVLNDQKKKGYKIISINDVQYYLGSSPNTALVAITTYLFEKV